MSVVNYTHKQSEDLNIVIFLFNFGSAPYVLLE